MKIIKTNITGCFEVYPLDLRDHRGRFVKPFHQEEFINLVVLHPGEPME